MSNEKSTQSSEGVLKLDEAAIRAAPLPLEHAEKGSLRSMWELIMQLRVLLPYLTRLVPLLDRGLLKAAPDLSEFRKDLQDVHTGSRGLETQVRNQSLRLERIEEQLLHLREITERSRKETGQLPAVLQSLKGWVRALTILAAVASVMLIIMAVFLFAHTGH